MKKTTTKFSEIKLVGISARTNNAAEMAPETGKIGPTLQRYFGENIAENIKNRSKPGVTYCVYTEFESDENGDYTYFVGEQVDDLDEQAMATITIPAQTYTQFTVGPGAMPDVCIQAWQDIWQMSPDDFAGKRTYLADFEVYDERAQDPNNTTLDINIGVAD